MRLPMDDQLIGNWCRATAGACELTHATMLCRWGMYAPGIVGIILGIILLGVTKDSPESAGFPPVEETAAKKSPSGALGLIPCSHLLPGSE